MARKSLDLPTTQEIERLQSEGNINKLIEYNEKLAKVANQRMAQMWKSGLRSSEALARAKYYIYQVSEVQTGGVFSRSKKLSAQQYVDQIKEELIFLRSQSSTVSGEKRARAEKSFETLVRGRTTEEGKLIKLDLPTEIQVPEEYVGDEMTYFKNMFFKFLEQDVWKDIRKYLYTAEDTSILQQAGEAIARGAKISELNEAYRAYIKKEVKTDIFTIWENWTSIK